MTDTLLKTKLYIPPLRPNRVTRPRLIDRLNQTLQPGHKLTLVSAPAGFGKSTLVSEWVGRCGRPVAWLSLDEGDNDPARFLAYLVAALQTMAPTMGERVLAALQSPQPPPIESILATLLNDITTLPNLSSTDSQEGFVLVLDDYHVVDAQPVDQALTFLLEHLPPQMHLVIATREDPPLPLARLRAQGQLTELRAADLRFTDAEAAEFLNRVMGLNLTPADIAALENRTEGWIAGLQLAALSMQGHHDTADFIQSFTGSHHFVLDYLVEEVLERQPASVQAFLLRTAILDRLCGPLCDAVLHGDPGPHPTPAGSGQETLAYLEQANLFLIPLDNERRWYRYHHLFAELLRQRLQQSLASSTGDAASGLNELHIRASQWYEDNGLPIEAFHHAAAANDIERVERLIGGNRIPQHFRGAVTAILDWLGSLPETVLDTRPWLRWRYASLLLVNGQTTGVEEKLDAAEAALHGAEPDEESRNLIGQIATARAVLALTRYQPETMLAQSHRALEYLHPSNVVSRATAHWTLGYAHLYQGERAAARQALSDGVALSQTAGDIFTTLLATIGLGNVQELENQLHLAAETYRRVLHLAGDQPLQIVYEAHLGLARILYEWNDLAAAEQHGRESLHLARQYDRVIDRFIVCEIFLARLKMAGGDVAGAAELLAQAEQAARQRNFVYRIPEVAAAQVLVLLRQGNLAAAAHLAESYKLPITLARVHLAQADPAAALAALEPWRRQVEARAWQDERLKVMVLQAVAYYAQGETETAGQLLADTLALAKPGGFIRLFVDEGQPMMHLLSAAAARGMMPDYIGKLLAAYGKSDGGTAATQLLAEPLSERELEVLRLLRTELNGPEIARELLISLNTMRTHTKNIYAKLGVNNRRAAVHRAEELHLL